MDVTLTNSLVTRNRSGAGGGVVVEAGGFQNETVSATFDHVIFRKNHALTGGGLYTADAQVLVQNCTFDGNTARDPEVNFRSPGGGLQLGGCAMGACTVVNSAFVKNHAVDGGGIFVFGTADLVNVTASRNTGRGGVGGIWIDSGTVLNSLVWGNRGNPRDVFAFTNADLDHSDVDEKSGPVTDLGGNINANPLFVSRSDIHLSPASPAIDTGTCMGAPTTDFEGDPRPTGAGCDMGADEFVP